MVCFDITFACKVHSRTSANDVNDVRFQHLCKHYDADLVSTITEDRIQLSRVIACDEDAVSILHDVPSPMYCVSIKVYRSDSILYQNAKVTHQKSIPPRDTLLKRVYWTASSLERRMLTRSQ
jgi:hypothetical protein